MAGRWAQAPRGCLSPTGLGRSAGRVYNHLGPEGNYLANFGPYFTSPYTTPWGSAVNFDGPGSDGVRRFFVENALYWIRDFHIDGLRLDAVHSIFDHTAYPFLEELGDAFMPKRRGPEPAGPGDAGKQCKRSRLVRPKNLGASGSMRSGQTTSIRFASPAYR
jgi:maltooligosyltrehalose trehalohydrolase